MTTTKKPFDDGFDAGVFFAMQHLVLEHDQPSLAKDIAKAAAIKKEWALKESKRSGYRVRRMNRFIREELT